MKGFTYDEFNRQRADRETLDILKKFEHGDGITDNELSLLLHFFTNLEGLLAGLGERYYLAWVDANRQLITLESYRRTRQEHAKSANSVRARLACIEKEI